MRSYFVFLTFRPEAVALVDAFDHSDYLLNSHWDAPMAKFMKTFSDGLKDQN